MLGLVPPHLMRLIDDAIPHQNGTELNRIIVAMIGAALLSGLIGVDQSYLMTVMSQGVMFERADSMRRGPAFYDLGGGLDF